MRIAVLVKQVPVLSKMEFDPASRRLRREGVPNEVSAFDVRALVKAVELSAEQGGEVVVFTMGPPQASEALLECLALGAHRAVHLCDPDFAGSDTLATARVLAAALRRESFDLVLCGKHSVDAETGQVGPEVAELLGLPFASGARRLEVDSGKIRVERETDSGTEVLEVDLPCVVSAGEDLAPERFSTRAEREAAKSKPIALVGRSDLGLAREDVGLPGSPTEVRDLETVVTERKLEMLEGPTVEAVVEKLVERLLAHGLFRGWSSLPEGPARPRATGAVERPGPKDIWVFAETENGSVRRVTFELLGKAREMADRLGSIVQAVLLGHGVRSRVEELAAAGADRVLLADDERLGWPSAETYAGVLAPALEKFRPGIVLFPSTTLGRDLAPRLAARFGLGLTGDCIDLDLDAEGRLVQYKPAFGGNVVAPILSRTIPEMATVRPGFLEHPSPGERGTCESLPLDVPELAPAKVRLLERRREAEAATALDDAEVVVGVGKGIGEPAALSRIEPLCEVLGAALCTTRDVTDAGWLPRQYQVGLTGRAIAPKLYLAVAIRGAMEHMVGVRRARIVVGINKNPKAPLFKSVDYGIVADWAEAVPLLVEKLRAARASTR